MTRHALIRRGLPVFLLILAQVAAATAATAGDPERDRILDLLRQGDPEAALPLARSYTDAHPTDADMLYNLGCLEAGHGEPDRALAALRSALDLNLVALDPAATDPDLDPLRNDPGFVALLDEHANRLALLAMERGVDLEAGRMSVTLPLHSRTPSTGEDEVFLRLRWQPQGLDLELTAAGPWAGMADAGVAAPWYGGPALLVTLAVPDGEPAWSSTNFWVFAFGMENETPVGALHLAGRNRWQRIIELDPKLRFDSDDRMILRTTLPWDTLLPYHPLLDPVLGLNAALVVPGQKSDDSQGADALVAELLPDGAGFDPTAPVRRVVPMEFDLETYAEESFLGRLSRSISGDTPLDVDLAAQTRDPGRAYLTVDILDQQQRSVVPGGARSGGLDLEAGPTRISRQIDFTGLDTGPYLVQATLEFPSGRDAVWRANVLHLATGWQDTLAAGVATLAASERATGRLLLDELETAVAGHLNRRDPGAIATTLVDLQEMLELAASTGTIVPRDGPFLMVIPGAQGADRLSYGFLPGAPAQMPRKAVLVLTGAPGLEEGYVARIKQFYEHEPPRRTAGGTAPVYIFPALPGSDPGEAQVALAWTMEQFGLEQVALAGVDAGAGTALKLAQAVPGHVSRLAIMAGAGLEPWPGATDSVLAAELAGLPTDLPVDWYDFGTETNREGQARRLRSALDGLGLTDVTDHEVRGGLNLTQTADRLVIWAENSADR